LGFVTSPPVVHFISTPSQPTSTEILPLEPNFDTFEDEVAEETLTEADLRRILAELCPDVEGLPPDVVVDAEEPIVPPVDVSEEIPVVSPLPPALSRISTPIPLRIIPEDEVVVAPVHSA